MLRKLLDSSWLYFGLAGLLLAVAVASQIRFAPPGRPSGEVADISKLGEGEPWNVVFIVIDMLRADRLSAYGYERGTSPTLAALADSGIRFEAVEAQSSWTKASMASLWTGMYPERTGIQRFFHAMPEQAVLPAELFKDRGYRTAGIWRNGWVANNFGFGQGFDLYIRPRVNRPEHGIIRNTPGVSGLPGTDMDATLSAIEFLSGARDDPFFLYVHYMDVHQYLYTDLSPDYGSSFSDIYDSSIFWTDYNVGQIVQALRDLEIADRTLIVVVSDHGEAFFEHGQEGHARMLYREVLDTPWIIALPFELDPGIVVRQRVANVDVWPTLLDMLDMPPLPGAEGQSVLPLVLDAAAGNDDGESDRPIFAQLDRSWGQVEADSNPTLTMVKGPYRLMQWLKNPARTELFDRSEDPKEQVNIAVREPELVDALKAEVEAFLAKPKSEWAEAPEIELDEMRINQLRALGYAIEGPNRKRKRGDDAAEDAAPEAGEAPAP